MEPIPQDGKGVLQQQHNVQLCRMSVVLQCAVTSSCMQRGWKLSLFMTHSLEMLVEFLVEKRQLST